MHAVDDYSCNYDFFFFGAKQAERHQSQTFSSLTPSTCDYTPLPAALNHSPFEMKGCRGPFPVFLTALNSLLIS